MTRRELFGHRRKVSHPQDAALAAPEHLRSLKVTSAIVSIAWRTRTSTDLGPTTRCCATAALAERTSPRSTIAA